MPTNRERLPRTPLPLAVLNQLAERPMHRVWVPKAQSTQPRPVQTGYDQPSSMALFLLYACLRLIIDLALAPLQDRAADQAELLVLRQQVRALERHVKVVHWRPADRLVLAALARRLPRRSWSTLLIKPETVLRWHRELVRRRWATFARRPCEVCSGLSS